MLRNVVKLRDEEPDARIVHIRICGGPRSRRPGATRPLEQLRTAPRSPWQNGYVERFVGTLRRELLDHVVVLGERHLLGLVRKYARYYNEDRPHMALESDSPRTRATEPPSAGKVVALPRVAGLHHRYVRRAA